MEIIVLCNTTKTTFSSCFIMNLFIARKLYESKSECHKIVFLHQKSMIFKYFTPYIVQWLLVNFLSMYTCGPLFTMLLIFDS